MNILVNALPLTGLQTGMARYVRCLYREIAASSGVSVSYFDGAQCRHDMPSPADPAIWSKNTERLWSLPDGLIVGLNAVQWLRYEAKLRKRTQQKSYDVYHETTFFPAAIESVPVVYTLHDISLLKHRDKHPRERLWFFDLFFKRRLRYASHILTVSEYVRRELIEELGVPEYAITAVHEAPDPIFARQPHNETVRALESHGWPKEYVLFVGTLEPRKNLSALIRALSMAKTKVPLVLVGWQGWGRSEWRQEINAHGLEERVILAGYVDEAALVSLYNGASVFVYPSLYEGFGLPILEAMACGCPVICSNVSSLPEVAGDAALLIDPQRPEELSHALDKVLTDSELRRQMVARGLERASEFTWQKTAAGTLDVFARVARHSPHAKSNHFGI
jgi:glycosyltransferase involved in cell wall biosynthesis